MLSSWSAILFTALGSGVRTSGDVEGHLIDFGLSPCRNLGLDVFLLVSDVQILVGGRGQIFEQHVGLGPIS